MINPLTFLSEYKNAFIAILVLSLVAAYSVFIWRTATSVSATNYLRKEQQLQHQLDDSRKYNDKLSAQVGAVIDEKLSKITIKNTYITKEVQHEIDKTPVYHDCRNSPTVVRDIHNAITGTSTTTNE